jgi:polysaccharide export outer membrane protein
VSFGFLKGHFSGMTRLIAAIIAPALLFGCATALSNDPGATASLGPSAPYTLWPGDKLKIAVFQEAELTGEFQIDERGSFAYPLVGQISVRGLTIEQLREMLAARLAAGYIRNPSIAIEVLNYRPINIIGEVKRAGQYPYRPGVALHDIPAIAGGHSYRADESTLYIIRYRGGDPIEVDIDDKTIGIMPGDTIRIPERYL